MSIDDDSTCSPFTIAIPKSGLGLRAYGRDKFCADVTSNTVTGVKNEFFDPRTNILKNGSYVGEIPVLSAPWIEDDASIPDASPLDNIEGKNSCKREQLHTDYKCYESDDDDKDYSESKFSDRKKISRFSKRDDSYSEDDK